MPVSRAQSKKMEAAQATIVRWRDDPAAFVREVFGVEPDPWQAAGLKALAGNDRIAVRSGHGVGKTTWLAWAIIWFMSTRYPCKVPCTAPSRRQLHDVLWAELAAWHRKMIPILQRQFEWKHDRFELRAAPSESFAAARAARKEEPEAFQGFHSENLLFIADEASGVDDVIFVVGEGAMSTIGAKTLMTSNPTRNTGYFREAFGRHAGRWRPIHVSSADSPRVSKEWLTDMADRYGIDSDIYRVRVLGEFPRASTMQFIGTDIVDGAMQRVPTPLLTDPFIIGVDVARFGDDDSVIVFRKGRDARTHEPLRLHGVDTMTLAARVAEEHERFRADAVFIDGGGVGGGVVDRLTQLGVPVIEVQFGGKADRGIVGQDTGRYANKRAEMWGLMRDWLKVGAIANDQRLRDDLVGVEYGLNGRDEIQLERKEDMKRRGLSSPDMGDALALTFAYPVEPRVNAGGLARRQSVVSEWDPYLQEIGL